MLQSIRSVFVCIVAGLLVGCGPGWPTGQEEIESHFAEHRGDMVNLAAAIEDSEYVRISLTREGNIYAETYPGGRSQIRRLRDADAERWRRLLVDARIPKVVVDELGIVGLDVTHIVAGDDALAWQVSYRLEPGLLYPDRLCSDDHGDAPCGNCRVDMDESWSVFFEWLPESLDRSLIFEYVNGDMSPAEGKERRETVLKACSAARGRTFNISEIG